jgi:hypothetical protein
MIYIYKSQSNLCPFTLDESATTTTYDVLFEFVNDVTGETKLFTTTEIFNTTRTNDFYITETSSENFYTANVSLEAGQWSYTVYEMPTASPMSLDKTLSVGTLDVGRVYVTDTTSDVVEYGNDDKDNPTFE